MDSLRQRPAMHLRGVIAFSLLACFLYGIAAGLRADIGILLNPLAQHCHVTYEDVSFCIAVMQLIFGLSQPGFGFLAARKSNRFVLLMGSVLLAVSMVGIALSASFVGLFFFLSIIFGLGAGAMAFGLILTSAIYFVGREYSMLVAGILNAAAGMIGFILSPFLQTLLSAGGVVLAMTALLIPVLIMIPIGLFVTSRDPKRQEKTAEENISLKTVKQSLRQPVYLFLLAGFSTCGFHMVIIESHLFSQYVSYGLDPISASWAFSVYGIATIVGALTSGFLSSRLPKNKILTFLYGFRAFWTILYLFFLPKTMATAVLFAVGLGLTGDATVSPTAGIVQENFPIKQVATLMGIAFFCHQIGAFASAWLGGILLRLTGGYVTIWLLDVGLCLFASIMSWRAVSRPQA